MDTTRTDVAVAPVTKSGEIPADDPNSRWGSGGGEFGRVDDLGRFARFYDYVDAQVMYPGVLAYHGVEGTVNARLIVTPSGDCDWHRTSISSSQSHLRGFKKITSVFCTVVIRCAISNRIWATEARMVNA